MAGLKDAIGALAEWIPAIEAIPAYTCDHTDDRFVAGAIASQADYLVTTNALLRLPAARAEKA